jgi:hypothetical protein
VTEFFWQFAFNMKTPMTVIWVLVGLLAAIVIYDSRRIMGTMNEADSRYGIFEWRVWTSVNVATIVSVLWLLVQAVPSPTFRREIIEKPVVRVVERKVPIVKYARERTVYKVPTYEQAFKLCTDASMTGDGTAERCHRQATEAAMPPYRVRVRTTETPYRVLFETCMDRIGRYEAAAELVPKCQLFASRQQIPQKQ